MGSRTRSLVLLFALALSSWGCCHVPLAPPAEPDEVEVEEEAPEQSAPQYKCPFAADYCKEHFIHET